MSGGVRVVDYGMGNLASVLNAFARLGIPARLAGDPAEVAAAERLVLPGVGAFGDAVAEIDRRGLREAIRGAARAGVPVLGLCLGMQLLFEGSDESPGARGLGLLAGAVRRLGGEVRVPHVGWNRLEDVRPVPILAGVRSGEYLYFVHSYHCAAADPLAAAWFEYGGRCAAVAGSGSVWGVQAHPEKSQRTGEAILRNFAALESRPVHPLPPQAGRRPQDLSEGGERA